MSTTITTTPYRQRGFTKKVNNRQRRMFSRMAKASPYYYPGRPLYRPFKGQVAALRTYKKSAEIKAIDLYNFTVPMSTTTAFFLLNGVSSGAGFYNRVGSKIAMTSVHVYGPVVATKDNANNDYCRVLIVYDRQANGAEPILADILAQTRYDGAQTTTPFSAANLNNRDRFLILKDYRLNLNAVSGGFELGPIDPVHVHSQINCFLKLGNLVTQYKASTSPPAIGDISTGALWLVTVGTRDAATAAYNLTVSTRVRFADN